MESTGPATVLLVDDQPIVRHGIASLINHSKRFRVCGQAGTSAQALDLAEKLQPRLALMDFWLEGTVAIDLIEGMTASHPGIGILIFSKQGDAMLAHRALRAGAGGYLLKQEKPKQILQALDRVLEGKTYLSPDLLKRMLYYYAETKKGAGESRFCKLSDRELQIFRLLGGGLNLTQIAGKLALERKTVETYCLRMRKKLHAASLGELIREAIRWNSEL